MFDDKCEACRPHFEVCPDCDGRGVSTRYLGAYTADEMDELGHEFFDDVRMYDRPCDRCDGQRVILVHTDVCPAEEERREWAAAERSEARYFGYV